VGGDEIITIVERTQMEIEMKRRRMIAPCEQRGRWFLRPNYNRWDLHQLQGMDKDVGIWCGIEALEAS
jgi:hypothetical protein